MEMRVSYLSVGISLVLAVGCGRAPTSSSTVHAASASAALAASGPPPAEACALPAAPVSSSPDDQSLTGGPLAVCSSAPLTGWFRDGKCSAGADDTGVHVVCAKLTDEFLSFSKSKGNDLVTPRGAFPGLRAGQQWCLCAARWDEAERAGVAPPVVADATHATATRVVRAETLKAHALVRP